jgi:FlaG/FlaF family flagellin (archaellin)
MVAITVILAAVIWTFVLGLGDSLGDSQPTAQLSVQDVSNDTVTISHNGGDAVAVDDLRVTVGDDGEAAFSNSSDVDEGDQFRVGDTATFNESDTDGIESDVIVDGARLCVVHDPSNSFLLDRVLSIE